MKITISIAQLTVNQSNFQKNVDKLLYLIETLHPDKNHLLLLPELWSTGFTPLLDEAADFNESLILNLNQLAQEKDLIIAGTYITKRKELGFANRLIVQSPHRDLQVNYDKIHLIASMREKEWFFPGNTIRMVNLLDIPFGLAICYDLRFPELFRRMSNNGAMVFLLPSQWPRKRISHFQKLIPARAIENQAVFVSANVVGNIGNTMFGGQSMVADQYGELILNLGEGEDKIESVEIDSTDIQNWRDEFPVLTDRQDVEDFPLLFN